MTDMLLAGFPITNILRPAPEAQVAIGLPGAPSGNGFTTVSEVQKAFDWPGQGNELQFPQAPSVGLRGLMTWVPNQLGQSCNAFEFSRSHRAYLNGLG